MTIQRFIKLCRRHRHASGMWVLALTVLPTAWLYLSEPWPVRQRVMKVMFAVMSSDVEAVAAGGGGADVGTSSEGSSGGRSSFSSTGGSFDWRFSSSASSVPEPASLMLMAPALLLLKRRR